MTYVVLCTLETPKIHVYKRLGHQPPRIKATTWPRCLKVGMFQDLIVLYQVTSDEDSRVQNWITPGDPGSEP